MTSIKINKPKKGCFKGCLSFFIVGLIIISAILTIEPLGIAFGNGLSLLHRNGYIIPKESSIYKFTETKSGKGSGEYWLYAEDDTYYYTQMMAGENEPYLKILKEKAAATFKFDKFNYKTWNHTFLCGDLLTNFGLKKPKDLQFISCEQDSRAYYIANADYRVSGKNSKAVEDYFIKRFNMLPIFRSTTGWESDLLILKTKELSKINPNYELRITMVGDAIKSNPSNIDVESLEREAIPYFYVRVTIINPPTKN